MKKALKYIKKLFFSILILIAAYLLFSIVLSFLPVNKDFQEPVNSNYEVWIKSNGVHLDIVLPISNPLLDWNKVLNIPVEIKPEVKYAGFGWGDKAFYTQTPEWSDLKLSTAFNALFLRTDGALHVSFYSRLNINNNSIKLQVDEQQFKLLQSFILESFIFADNTVSEIKDIQYGSHDQFYDANFAYSLFYTCNTWTNEALKKAGLPACVWTPFDKGILFRLRKINQD